MSFIKFCVHMEKNCSQRENLYRLNLIAFPSSKTRLYVSIFAKDVTSARFACGFLFRYAVRYRVYYRKFPYLADPAYATTSFGAVTIDFLCTDKNFCFADILTPRFLRNLIVFHA